MEKADNIDFIKWMCDKAEGFRYEYIASYDTVYFVDKTKRQYLWHTSKFDKCLPVDDWTLYPILLQRAIEGVNMDHSKFVIVQNHKYIAACDALSKRHMSQFSDMPIDKAKESALKYIYEQESK